NGPDGAPMPCKITFEGVAPAPSPSFGSGTVAGPAGNQATTATGSVHVDLAAGSYHLTASRGPEYALAATDVVLAAGEHATRTLAPARVVDTRGYLACDFHQHTMRGLDSAVGSRDRVVSDVAEGVEVAVASEHNVISDLEPVVKELGMAREMVSIAGDELTSDALQSPWGHANAFPLAPDPAAARGGAPRIAERTAGDVFAEVRQRFGDVVIQVNHPRSGKTGYFDLLGFDAKRGAGDAPGYDATFDALEVWNGRNVETRTRVLADFLALLHAGHTVTPTANTDTHAIVAQEAGYPRTYVRVADDGHLDTWDGARSADLVKGIKVLRDVVLTNGPMLRVTANGAPIGGRARGPLVHVSVDVESAPWVEVDEVAVLLASGARFAKPVVEKAVGSVLHASVSFDVHPSAQDALVVVASGSRSLSPVLAESDADRPENKDILPWAMSGAISIDAEIDLRSRRSSSAAPPLAR
ncbi:MAG: CehA/McbA family metallohydrolase, partial [Polyangiaceae bacterium]